MLISLPELKAALGISESDYDDELTYAGNAVLRMMERYTQRPLKAQNITETFYGPRSHSIFLRGFPIESLSTVILNEGSNVAGDWRVDLNTGRLWQRGIRNYIGPSDEVVVTYRAGFTEVPDDLRHVFVEAVKIARAQQDRTMAASTLPVSTENSSGPVVKSVAIPDAITITYDNASSSSTAASTGNVWADTPIGPFVSILDSYRSERSYGAFG